MAFQNKAGNQSAEKAPDSESAANSEEVRKDLHPSLNHEGEEGGLYKNVNVPVSWINTAIIGGLALLVLLFLFGANHSGYTVRYNSTGGSDVEAQSYEFQQPLTLPEDPTREGYTFEGWSLHENGSEMAESGMPVENSMELYAVWQKNSQ